MHALRSLCSSLTYRTGWIDETPYSDHMSPLSGILPPTLRPPLDVALAKAVAAFPGPSALPGGSWYEPKFDGYRCLMVADHHEVTLWSRQRKELSRISMGVKRRCAGV